MNFPIAARAVAVVALVASTAMVPGKTETPRLDCLICLQESEPSRHSFLLNSAELCNTPEEQQQNGCTACGGTSECHPEPQTGDCHADCGPTLEENDLLTAYVNSDASALAEVLTRFDDRTDGDSAALELNRERQALQVIDCRGNVRRQLPLSEGQMTDILDNLQALRTKLH